MCPGGISHTEPIFEYDQSQGWKSITGGYVYRGTQYPDLVGHYIFTDFVDSRVFWLTEEVSENEFETEIFQFTGPGLPFNVATFGEATDGELYFATYIEGEIWRVGTEFMVNTQSVSPDQVNISPNPANKTLKIHTQSQLSREYIIIDNAGQKIKSGKMSNQLIDISELLPGSYILQLDIDGIAVNKKFIKE